MGILDETRGRPASGFNLLRSKWRFVWFTYELLLKKYSREIALSLLIPMIEQDSYSRLGDDGAIEYYSPAALAVRDNDADEYFLDANGEERWRSDIRTNIDRINRAIKAKGGLNDSEIEWHDRSLELFFEHHNSNLSEMSESNLTTAEELGWTSPLSTITGLRGY